MIAFARYVFQFLLVFFPKVADQVLTEQVSLKMIVVMMKMAIMMNDDM